MVQIVFHYTLQYTLSCDYPMATYRIKASYLEQMFNKIEGVRARMKIWIDADACPRVIKGITFRASERLSLPVILVANKNLSKHNSELIQSIVVTDGFDVADDYIAEHAGPEDLVITADIPLAARIVAKGGVALDPRGELYTEENVGERLSMRDLMMELRSEGLVHGGPAQFNLTDRQRFASSLDRTLTQMLRGKRH
jgi:uncharacterized protein YaiI (UPF0178 family)